MKKILLLMMTVVVITTVMADPKDNFKKSGLYLGGSVHGNFNISNVFDENKYEKDTHLGIGLYPYFGIFIIDNLSIRPRLSIYSYSTTTYHENDDDEYVKFEYGSTSIGGGVSAVYYMTNVGELIPYIGLGGSISRSYDKDDITDGKSTKNDASNQSSHISLEGGVLYFLNDNSAINIGVDLDYHNSRMLTSSEGEVYDYSDDSKKWESLNINFAIGFSYFFPAKSRYIITDL